jgi:hypothetical protein
VGKNDFVYILNLSPLEILCWEGSLPMSGKDVVSDACVLPGAVSGRLLSERFDLKVYTWSGGASQYLRN